MTHAAAALGLPWERRIDPADLALLTRASRRRATPLTLLTKVLLVDIDPSTRWLSFLIATIPVTTPADVPGAVDDVGDSGEPPHPAAAGSTPPSSANE